MKATRKLIPAIALLLVSAVLLSTASYAWFTTNKTVTGTMSVGVTAPQNLQISYANHNSGAWTNAVMFNDAAVKLTPVSSADGKSFVLVKGLVLDEDGVLGTDDLEKIGVDVNAGGYAGSIDTLDEDNDGAGEYYWLEYEFQLRATTAIDGTEWVLGLDVAVSASEAYLDAMRIFIYEGDNLVYSSNGNLDAADADDKPIISTGSGFELGTPVTLEDNAADVELAAATPKTFTVIVFIEGNDTACVSANVDTNPDVDITITFTTSEV